jgi:hypothetical protein
MSKLNTLIIVAALAAVLVAGAASATTVPTSAAVFTRVFNDCPFSTVEVTNTYPGLVSITDTKASCGAGFANRHAWRFSLDGTTAQLFANNDGFRFSADLTISGTGEAEAGIGISPWWSQLVDGTFNFRTTDGEIACFGGRLPFYSFTGSQGVTYVKGTTVHVEVIYMPNGLEELNPATIEYILDNGTEHTSGALPFDMGNEAEAPEHGLWGMLTPATAGGNFQFFLQQGAADASVTVAWANIMFTDLGTVATESTTWGSVKSLFQ